MFCSLKNISINFNGNNALKISESNLNNKLLKTKNDQSFDYSFSTSKNSNNLANSENLISNSETNINSIELNTSIIVSDSNPNSNNDMKQINLGSTANSVYILEETFKLNKKNVFNKQNAGSNRRENTHATDLNLPHVKQIESNYLKRN